MGSPDKANHCDHLRHYSPSSLTGSVMLSILTVGVGCTTVEDALRVHQLVSLAKEAVDVLLGGNYEELSYLATTQRPRCMRNGQDGAKSSCLREETPQA